MISSSSRSRPTVEVARAGRFEFAGASASVRNPPRNSSRNRSAGGVNGTSRAVITEIVRASRQRWTSSTASVPASSSRSRPNRLIAAIPAPPATASLTASQEGSSSVRTACRPICQRAASTAARVADPSSRETQVNPSRSFGRSLRPPSDGAPTSTTSSSTSGSLSSSGGTVMPPTTASSTSCERTSSSDPPDVESRTSSSTAGRSSWNRASTAGSRYVPGIPDAASESVPICASAPVASARRALARSASARST